MRLVQASTGTPVDGRHICFEKSSRVMVGVKTNDAPNKKDIQISDEREKMLKISPIRVQTGEDSPDRIQLEEAP